VQIAPLSLVGVEMAWQNMESMRDKYVRKKYDPTRGGDRLSKGNLYCPVFRKSFHDIFFMDVDVDKVLRNVAVPVDSVGASQTVACVGGASSSGAGVVDDPRVGEKRLRQG
jgi:hypothetical protein